MSYNTESPYTDPTHVEPLVSLRFILSELRRRRWVWVLAAVVGLLIGAGYHQIFPRTYHGTATMVLAHNLNEDPSSAMSTDVALAHTRAVAAQAVSKLKVSTDPTDFMADYTASSITPSLLQITAAGSSYTQAVARANATASAFLDYRNGQLQTQNQTVADTLTNQIKRINTALASVKAQINNVSANSTGTVTALVTEQNQEQGEVTSLESTIAANSLSVTTITGGSHVIDPATVVRQSTKKATVVNAITGLVAGAGLGILVVVIAGLLSDKLRSRRDVALALEAPVDLSIRHRWLLRRRRSEEKTSVADHLHRQLLASSERVPLLAIVAVDNVKEAVAVVDLLARRLATEGQRVLVADLSPEATLAGHYGVASGDSKVVVAPPDNDAAPSGSLTIGRPAGETLASGALATQDTLDLAGVEVVEPWGVQSDLVLTLTELDPARGAEHLKGWATHATVIVTSGRSSGVKIQSVGAMIRNSTIQLDSAVLLDADPHDESNGTLRLPAAILSDGTYAGVARRQQ